MKEFQRTIKLKKEITKIIGSPLSKSLKTVWEFRMSLIRSTAHWHIFFFLEADQGCAASPHSCMELGSDSLIFAAWEMAEHISTASHECQGAWKVVSDLFIRMSENT